MTNVSPLFKFDDQQLRTQIIDGEPWFVLNDVCRILGAYMMRSGKANVTMAAKGLDADETRLNNIDTPCPSRPDLQTAMRLVSRPGMFKLIARSSKLEAKRFDRWVRHEVLPQIMDHGGYMMRDADVEAVVANTSDKSRASLDVMAQMLSAIQVAQAHIAELQLQAEAAAPKVEFVDKFVDAKGLYGIRVTANILGITQNKFVSGLISKGILYRDGSGRLLPKATHRHHFVVKTVAYGQHGLTFRTYVTPEGLTWLTGSSGPSLKAA